MNLLPLLLGALLIGGMSKKQNKQSIDLSSLLSNPDILAILPHVAKLFDKNATEQDKNLAIMNLATNPALFEVLQKFYPKNSNDNDSQTADEKDTQQTEQKQTDSNDCNNNCNNDCNNDKKDAKQTFSDESKEFFKPVEKVAGIEISQKLYDLYDNWYTKK